MVQHGSNHAHTAGPRSWSERPGGRTDLLAATLFLRLCELCASSPMSVTVCAAAGYYLKLGSNPITTTQLPGPCTRYKKKESGGAPTLGGYPERVEIYTPFDPSLVLVSICIPDTQDDMRSPSSIELVARVGQQSTHYKVPTTAFCAELTGEVLSLRHPHKITSRASTPW